MQFKIAREIANKWRTGETMPLSLPTTYDALIILDDRITELEAENEILLQQAIDRENWKADAKKSWGRITELEAQRDGLVTACKALMNAQEADAWSIAIDIGLIAIEKAAVSNKEDKGVPTRPN